MKTRIQPRLILPLLVSLAFPAAGLAQTADLTRTLAKADHLLRDRQYRQAAAAFERASELAGGECAQCLLGVARAYRGSGQIDAALQVTRMAWPLLSAPGERARAYDQLGSLLVLKGDLDAARIAFQKAVELDAEMGPQVRSSLAEALRQRANVATAAAKPPNAPPAEVEITRGPGGRLR
jgi:tetratricopeptide (TPR) repeat protein